MDDQTATDLVKRLLAEGQSFMNRVLQLRRAGLSLGDAKRIDLAARGITVEEHERQLADALEAWLPGSQPPLFPGAARWIPSWSVEVEGRTTYIKFFHMAEEHIHIRTDDHDWGARGSVEEQIERHFARARHDMEKMWGKGRPTYIVPPDLNESDLSPGSWSSPRYRCMAWLSSSAMDGEKHGSHAFVIWWQEGGTEPDVTQYQADCPHPIEAVERILKAVPWTTIAADYYI